MNTNPPESFPAWMFGVLFVTGLASGFVDSIAGGGGLISLPVMLSVGLPPKLALGTNKLQASFGSGSAAWHYSQAKIVSLRDCRLGVVFTIIGAAIGTITVQHLDPSFLKRLMPILLFAIAAAMIFKPTLGDSDIHPRMKAWTFYIIAGLALGFYDGFIGPGVGTIWTMAFMLGIGFNLTRATGYTKVMNFASNLVSLAFFACAGLVNYPAGIVMGVGQFLGARLGSKMVVKRGTRFIRPIFLTAVFAIILKLVYDTWFRHP